MFSIGEFSKATGLTVKALRFYHEQGVLVPAHVDRDTGYRRYEEAQTETASVIVRLRDVGFSVKEIAQIVRSCADDADVLRALEARRDAIARQLDDLQDARARLDTILSKEREARRLMSESTYEIEEKMLPPVRVAGLRMRGRYQDCGKAFAKLGRMFGRHIAGNAMMLCYDQEYKEDDADFEPCVPVRGGESKDGVDVRELAGGRCLSLLHKGPYETLHRSYKRLLARVEENGLRVASPCREVYIKGPGMIFRGNPKRYLTEIQMLVEE